MRQPESTREASAQGGTIVAAALLVLVGLWQALLGLAALGAAGFFITDPSYSYRFSAAAWGWIHLLLGAVLVVVGLALFTGALWARVAGVVLALLVALAHFMFLPYYPIGSLVVILGSFLVIWSLANAPTRPSPPGGASR